MSIVAAMIRQDGEFDSIFLLEDEAVRLCQLQDIVGGFIETVSLPGERHMVINENGKDGPHMINHTATAIAHEAESIMPTDYIAGVAVIIPAEVLQ